MRGRKCHICIIFSAAGGLNDVDESENDDDKCDDDR